MGQSSQGLNPDYPSDGRFLTTSNLYAIVTPWMQRSLPAPPFLKAHNGPLECARYTHEFRGGIAITAQHPEQNRNPADSQDLTMQDEELLPDVMKIAPVWPVAGPSGVVVTDEGIVVVDTGIAGGGADRVRRIRERTDIPFHSIIYSHGHLDHVGGAPAFVEDARERGNPTPRIIGHEWVAKRFDKYRMLAGRRRYITSLQFPGAAQPPPPGKGKTAGSSYHLIYPDTTFSDYMEFKLGGLTFELYHSPAETDDALWVWVPERKLAMIGDLLLRGCPNTGNPLKEQRYTLEWADALEKIADKKPDLIIADPGVLRGEPARQQCLKTAKFLRHIHDEVVRLLNEGYWIEDILEKVNIPDDLAAEPFLAGTYGHPTFVIHDVYRRYTGWYDGNPSELFPSRSSDIAADVVRFVRPEQVIDRARELQQDGNTQLALHVVDFAVKGTEDGEKRQEALRLKAELLDARARQVRNFIASNIMRTNAAALREEADLAPRDHAT